MPRNIYDEDHEAFRASAREFVERTLAPRAEEMIRDHVIARDIWLEAGKQGFFGLTIPEEFGGAGIDDYRFNAIFAEEISKFTAAVASCFGIHSDVTAPYIVSLGTEEQKQKYLPRVATGELILSIGMTEPSGGSDLANLKSTAVKADDGSGDWILNGSKTFITNGHQCDVAVVAARTDPSKGAKGISLFLVEAGTEGLKVSDDPAMGVRASHTGRLHLENVEVSADNLLGTSEDALDAIRRSRLAWAALACGTGRAVLDQVSQYVTERKAFGEPIGHRQAVAFTVANIAIELDGMRLATLRAAARLDSGRKPEAAAEAIAHARALVTKYGAQIGSDAVQLLGGHGFVKEFDNERWYRDLRGAGVLEGTLLV